MKKKELKIPKNFFKSQKYKINFDRESFSRARKVVLLDRMKKQKQSMERVDETRLKYQVKEILIGGLGMERGEPVISWKAVKQILDLINLAQEELREEMIKLSDDIESKYGTPDIEEWKAFKHFRNKMRDNLTN